MQTEALVKDHNPWWEDSAARRAFAWPRRRDVHGELLERINDRRNRRATLLIGPRQVGKTVLLRQLADDLLNAGFPPAALTYFDFSDDRITDPPTARRIAELQPAGLPEGAPRVFLLDEIRLAPQWDRWLKQAVDQGGLRIVATDSAASLLRTASRESGIGRWDEIGLEGLTFAEFIRLASAEPEINDEAYPPELLQRYLTIGGFPEHARDDRSFLVHEALRADIVDRAILRDLESTKLNLTQLRTLFVYLAETSGARFNASKYAQNLGAHRHSVSAWLERLEQTLLIKQLPRFATKPSVRARALPKIYAFDPGIVAAFAYAGRVDSALRGRLFETAVFRHLRQVPRANLSYAGKSGKPEVDFVVHQGDDLIALEVTSRDVRAEKVRSTRQAADRIQASRAILVHGGLDTGTSQGVDKVPLPTFLFNPLAYFQEAP